MLGSAATLHKRINLSIVVGDRFEAAVHRIKEQVLPRVLAALRKHSREHLLSKCPLRLTGRRGSPNWDIALK